MLVKRGTGLEDGWFWSLLGLASESEDANPGNLFFQVSGGLDPHGKSAGELPLNSWHHAVTTYSSADQTLKMYLDGRLDSVQTGIPSPSITTTDNLFIGRDSLNTTEGYFFQGALDDIRIYNRALSESEIIELFWEGTNYIKATIDHDKIDEDLMDFPVVMKLDESNAQDFFDRIVSDPANSLKFQVVNEQG
ncbi:hypothetical protein D1BOALGB6SA_8591, partial [Olavius sp. associated proteobacterium Delta 1]